ncbi:MAG: phosphodiester glycosidase family protein, partial [Candidatus Marinimicrobia bacterium]|nr:phosphodiester glycosidase family protein [Candidatus Neomarinimicrobiota bacterium]
HVVEIDLQNPYITLESIKADDLRYGREGTRNMSARSDRPEHRVVSAINGDFYNTTNGVPINNQVVNGEFVHAYSYHRSAFGYSNSGKPCIIIPSFSGTVISRGESYPLTTVNRDRYTDYLVIYNNFMGNSTQTNTWGFECLVRPISAWSVNDTVYCVIEARETGSDPATGNMAIPEGKFVLSGHGAGTTFLSEHCQIGDTVKIVQQLANSLPGLTQLVGGGPRMLENGVNIVSIAYPQEGIESSFCSARHPRTAIGYNADSTIAYFVVVDGRQEHSLGMSLYELADFMKYIGAAYAVNFDGGGSSTFTVRSEIMNIPSDGWQRIVANAMMCVSTAPDSDLSIVQIERDSIALYKNISVDIPISGWDANYNPQDIPGDAGLIISHTENLGIYADGVFTAAAIDMDGYIYAELGESTDSMSVHIIDIDSLTAYPQFVVTDTLRPISFFVYGCEDGRSKTVLDNSIFEFELLNNSTGSINAEGVFTPTSSGESLLLVHYGSDVDTAYIYIERGIGEQVIDEVESLDNWILQGENLDTALTILTLIDRNTGSGNKAIKIDYTTTDDGIITLNTDPITIYGIPQDFLIDALSDGLNHRLYLVFDDANGNEYKFKAAGFFNDNDEFVTKTVSTEAIIPGDGGEYYPMHLKQIIINLANGIQSGTLYVDRIRCTYPGWTGIEENYQPEVPDSYQLQQNYPNPFNPNTTISFSLARAASIQLDVYDISGNHVMALSDGYKEAGSYAIDFRADNLPTGIYYYKLQIGTWSDTKKMVLIK